MGVEDVSKRSAFSPPVFGDLRACMPVIPDQATVAFHLERRNRDPKSQAIIEGLALRTIPLGIKRYLYFYNAQPEELVGEVWETVRSCVKNADPSMPNHFSTYLFASMRDKLRAPRTTFRPGPVQLSSEELGILGKIRGTEEGLFQRLGRAPTLWEMYESSGLFDADKPEGPSADSYDISGYPKRMSFFDFTLLATLGQTSLSFVDEDASPTSFEYASDSALIYYLNDKDPSVDPQANLERRELTYKVYGVLDNMPPHLAELLELRYMDGMPLDEIAEKLNLPKTKVKSRLDSARAKFRHLAPELATEHQI